MSVPEHKISIKIPMLPNMELAATKTAAAIAKLLQLDENRVDEIKIALIEAILNAFEHSKSKDRNVYVTFQVSPETLIIIVQDHGQGFSPNNVEEPSIHKKIHTTHKRGWGLKIMAGLMDNVSIYSDGYGTTIVLEKKIRHEGVSDV